MGLNNRLAEMSNTGCCWPNIFAHPGRVHPEWSYPLAKTTLIGDAQCRWLSMIEEFEDVYRMVAVNSLIYRVDLNGFGAKRGRTQGQLFHNDFPGATQLESLSLQITFRQLNLAPRRHGSGGLNRRSDGIDRYI